MDFNFSDDQQSLRDATAKWVERGYTFERRRAIVEKEGGFSQQAWNEMAELGLTGLYVPEADGGLGLGPVDGMVVMEELGRGLVMEPLAQSLIAGATLAKYADAQLRAAWQPRIASGQALVVLAQQEAGNRYRLDRSATRVAVNGSQVRVDGVKTLVPAGDKATAYLVPGMAGDQLVLALVDAASPDGGARGFGCPDGSRAAEVTFRGAAGTLVAAAGLEALEWAVDVGIAATCAEGVGVMDKTFDLTAEYLNTRKQFGVLIGSFQALRHRLADMKMALELARSMSYYASLKLGAPLDERRRAMARAKYQLGVSMRFVGQQSVQLHGGIGVTDEYVGSHYFKRLTQMETVFGDTLHHLGEVSARMQDTAGVFA